MEGHITTNQKIGSMNLLTEHLLIRSRMKIISKIHLICHPPISLRESSNQESTHSLLHFKTSHHILMKLRIQLFMHLTGDTSKVITPQSATVTKMTMHHLYTIVTIAA
jgi:hypothetical protein